MAVDSPNKGGLGHQQKRLSHLSVAEVIFFEALSDPQIAPMDAGFLMFAERKARPKHQGK